MRVIAAGHLASHCGGPAASQDASSDVPLACDRPPAAVAGGDVAPA